MTLMDLAALVVGVAAAVSMERTSGFQISSLIAGTAWEPLAQGIMLGIECSQKACVALLPVIAARRVRYDSLIRPAEFLCVCVAAPLWLVVIPRFLFVRVPNPGNPRGYGYPPGVIQGFNDVVFLTGILAAVLLPLARRRRPRWIDSVLLCLAWIGLERGGMARFALLVNPLLAPPGRDSSMTTYLARQLIFGLPRNLLLFIPAFAAITSLSRPRRTWIEWAGLACPILWWLTTEATLLIVMYLGSRRAVAGRPFAATEGIHYALILLAALSSIVLVRSLHPAWNRWFGVGYDGSDPESPQPEA